MKTQPKKHKSETLESFIKDLERFLKDSERHGIFDRLFSKRSEMEDLIKDILERLYKIKREINK